MTATWQMCFQLACGLVVEDADRSVECRDGGAQLCDVAHQLRIDDKMPHSVCARKLADAAERAEEPLVNLSQHEMIF